MRQTRERTRTEVRSRLRFERMSMVAERHVTFQWKKTHFLSFSSSRDRALVFAAGPDRDPTELYATDDAERWDAAVLTLGTGTFESCVEVETGMYRCTYRGDIQYARTPACVSSRTVLDL